MAAKKDMRGSSKIFDLAHNDHEGFAKAIAAARQDFQVKWWWKYGQPKIDFIRATLEVDSRALGAVVTEVMHLNRQGIQTTLEAFPNGIPNPEIFRLEVEIQKPV
jgi:hypothetical protein